MIKSKERLTTYWRLRVFACAAIINGAFIFAAPQASVAQPPAAPASASGGVYTAAQAERGNALYQDSCAACHGGSLQGEDENPSLSGKRFSGHWGGQPLSELFSFINNQMPLGQPGALGSQGDADVLAYILAVNRFPAGAKELPPDANVLGTITVDKR